MFSKLKRLLTRSNWSIQELVCAVCALLIISLRILMLPLVSSKINGYKLFYFLLASYYGWEHTFAPSILFHFKCPLHIFRFEQNHEPVNNKDAATVDSIFSTRCSIAQRFCVWKRSNRCVLFFSFFICLFNKDIFREVCEGVQVSKFTLNFNVFFNWYIYWLKCDC